MPTKLRKRKNQAFRVDELGGLGEAQRAQLGDHSGRHQQDAEMGLNRLAALLMVLVVLSWPASVVAH